MQDAVRTASMTSAYFWATRSWFWLFCVDIYPVLVAVCLPWSTTAVAVFMAIWFVVLLPTIEPSAFLNTLKLPALWLPLAFFALAILGMLWADAPWSTRIHGADPVVKLLAIPLLAYHFGRSRRGHWVLVAFLFSCTVLMLASWVVLFEPGWRTVHAHYRGVPVKNYIDQSQAFALCVFALVYLVSTLPRRRFLLGAIGAALTLGFYTNLLFVLGARTALVYMPVLLVLFAARYLSRRAGVIFCSAVIAITALVWFESPYLRDRVELVETEYQQYKDTNVATSTGLRLEWWRRSAAFIREAPLLGNGTGATRELLDRDAQGKTGLWGASIGNPHNQTLNVAIQWGAVGCLVLYAMWYFHLMLFWRSTTLAAWVGLIVVVQNVISSLFNSHLFDFTEGWIYVMGVGVAAGMMAARADAAPAMLREYPPPGPISGPGPNAPAGR
jgi:O-antigen ligase